MQINGRPDGRAERADDETIFTLLTHIIHTSYVTKHYIHTHTDTRPYEGREEKGNSHAGGVRRPSYIWLWNDVLALAEGELRRVGKRECQ